MNNMNKKLIVVFFVVIALSIVCAAIAFFLPREGNNAGLTIVKAPEQTEAGRPDAFPDPEENFVKLPKGTNLAEGKTVAAGDVTEVYAATNAVDGDVTSYWESKGVPAEIVIDLAERHSVQTVAIRLNPAAIWEARAQTIAVFVSDDGERFSPAAEAAKYDFSPDTGNRVRIDFDPISARFVKLVFSANSSGRSGGAQAAEIMIFE